MLFERHSRRPHQYLWLALISLLALGIRLYRLGAWSFWIDEIYTINAASWLLQAYGVPKLSTLLISLVQLVTAINEWSMRLVPALAGALTIPVLYFPTRKLYGVPVALLSILLLALSPWHLYWSQNARFYTMQLLLYVLFSFLFLYGVTENRRAYLLGAALFFFLAVLERQTTFMFVPVAFLYLAIVNVSEGPQPRRLFKQAVPIVIPILAYGLYQPMLVSHFIDTFIGYPNHSPWRLFLAMVYSIGVPIFCLALAGGLSLLQQRTRENLFVVLSAGVPFLLLLALSPIAFTVDRYIFVAFPFWIILAAVALVRIITRLGTDGRVLALGVLLLVLADPIGQNYLYFNYQNGNRPDWRAAFAVIERQQAAGDLVVTKRPELGDYYLGMTPLHIDRVDIETLVKRERPIWFIEDIDWVNPPMQRWVKQNSTLIRVLDVYMPGKTLKMRIYRYDPATTGETVGK